DLDKHLDTPPSIHHFLAARGAEGVFVCSAQELEMVEASQGPADLRVINLSPAVTAREVARHLQGAPGTTLVFYAPTAQGREQLSILPGVQCLERPRGAEALAQVLERTFGRMDPGVKAAAPAGQAGSAVVVDRTRQSAAISQRI